MVPHSMSARFTRAPRRCEPAGGYPGQSGGWSADDREIGGDRRRVSLRSRAWGHSTSTPRSPARTGSVRRGACRGTGRSGDPTAATWRRSRCGPPARTRDLRRPASFDCHFLGVADFDAGATSPCRTLRRTKRAESIAVSMTQGGAPILEAMVVGRSGTVGGLEHDAWTMPEVPDPRSALRPPSGWRRPVAADAACSAFWDNLEFRPCDWIDDWDNRPPGRVPRARAGTGSGRTPRSPTRSSMPRGRCSCSTRCCGRSQRAGTRRTPTGMRRASTCRCGSTRSHPTTSSCSPTRTRRRRATAWSRGVGSIWSRVRRLLAHGWPADAVPAASTSTRIPGSAADRPRVGRRRRP